VNTNLKVILVAGVLALGCSAAGAQDSIPAAATMGQAGEAVVTPLNRGNAVIGEPYSAHTETETTQTLSDGTTITRKLNARNSFRDSQGRTRTELYGSPMSGPGDTDQVLSILIYDPTTGEGYALNVRDHTAREMGRPRAIISGTGDLPAAITSVNPGAIPRLAPGADGSPGRVRPKSTTEDLGTQEMEGLTVKGWRTTFEYPTGSMGNDRPFRVVTERWVSNDLRIIVMSKRADPRTGESITQLTNLDRSEPDASLFQVPEDYTIVGRETVGGEPQ
jgi:hypothetical protein